MSKQSVSDAVLVERVLDGDMTVCNVLVDRHYARALQYACHFLNDQDEAEDAVQNAFVNAFQSLSRLQEPGRFGSWLLQILVNGCRNTYRHRKFRKDREQQWVNEECLVHGTVDEPFAGEQPTEEEQPRNARGGCTNQRIARALETLPAGCREAVVLKYMEERSYEDIAAITRVSIPALKMRASRGCELMRRELEPYQKHSQKHSQGGSHV